MTTRRFHSFIGWGAAVMLSAMLASHAYADITAKKFGLGLDKTIIHSDLSIKHYLRSVNQRDGVIKQEPRLRLVPTAGIKVFDKALDIYVVGYFDRLENTTAVQQTKQARLYLESKPWKIAKVFSIQPYVLHRFPGLGADASTLLASVQGISSSFKTGLGKITHAIGVEVGTYVNGKTQETDYEIETGVQESSLTSLGLRRDDAGAIRGDKKDQDFYHEWYASFSMVPSAFKKLSIDFTTWYTNEYAPAYKIKTSGKEESRYVLAQSTTERLRLTYKLGERLSVRNDFIAYQIGAFESRKDEGQESFINELGLIYEIL
ncbi:MAG: hypothetical protein HRU09_17935 [Oligoflexales bacterium]|nr:hypothetical protein [Oligoflexales bacterium]